MDEKFSQYNLDQTNAPPQTTISPQANNEMIGLQPDVNTNAVSPSPHNQVYGTAAGDSETPIQTTYVTPSNSSTTPSSNQTPQSGINFRSLLTLIVILCFSLVLAYEGLHIATQATVPQNYSTTTAMVSNSNCTSENLTFKSQTGDSYTVKFNVPTAPKSGCSAAQNGQTLTIAYSPSVKLPF